MQSTIDPRPEQAVRQIVAGTLGSVGLVAVGLGLAYLVLSTPLVAWLVAGGSRSENPTIVPGVAVLAIIAGLAFLTAGTNRLAVIAARVRRRTSRRSAVARAIAAIDGVLVVTDAVPTDGRPIPIVAIGPFGVAIVHETGSGDPIRRMGDGWEARRDGHWVVAESPVDRADRDAERIRHWLSNGDLDFVVRVYAALVTADGSLVRTPKCAVIGAEQVPAWIAALPRQRSLSEGRRALLRSRLEGTRGHPGATVGW